jgi:hypothetical protein
LVQSLCALSLVFALPLGARLTNQYIGRRSIIGACATLIGIVLFILFASLFVCFDLFSVNFSWLAFHERDFGRAADFVLGRGLSHLGPEMIGGGNLPGPGLTLFFSIPLIRFFKRIRITH